MHKIKSIQIIFILSILTFALPISAKEKNVELYFFYSPLCPASHQAEIKIGTLKTKYPYLQIKKFRIPEKNNQKIYSALAKIYQIHSDSIPSIFIEKMGFNGCSSTTISEIEKILIRCSKQECDSPTQKLLTTSFKKETPTSKLNFNIIYIAAGILILCFLSIKIFFKKEKKVIR